MFSAPPHTIMEATLPWGAFTLRCADRALRAMNKNGRVAYPNGVEPTPKAPSGVKVQSYDVEPSPEQIEKLNRLIEAGPFEVHVARTFPLDKAADAHRELDKHYLGKLALRPQ